MSKPIIITNRRTKFNYELGSKITAGISLSGQEVKAIRQQRVSLTNTYVEIKDDQVILKNLEIFIDSKQQSSTNTSQKHQLLLTKSQIKSLKRDLDIKYNTIAVTRLILGKYIKLEIAPARGKKLYDKRQIIQKRDSQRQIRRDLKR